MITGFTVRVDFGDMVIWNEVFASNSQAAFEVVVKEKLSIGDHAMIDSEFLNRLADKVVYELPYCSSVSVVQFLFADNEISIDIISNNLVSGESNG